MKLYLMRHGEARSESEDPQRSLTVKGEEGTRKISEALIKLSIGPLKICHSSKKRAEQTARIIAAGLGMTAQMSQGLKPNDAVRPWVERIFKESEDLMIVGHLPFLENLASLLVCGDEGRKVVAFSCSTIVCLHKKEAATWVIEWVLTPETI